MREGRSQQGEDKVRGRGVQYILSLCRSWVQLGGR